MVETRELKMIAFSLETGEKYLPAARDILKLSGLLGIDETREVIERWGTEKPEN